MARTPWAGSNRRDQLPTDWPRTRQRILRRDGHRCQSDQHVPACDGTATHVDHIQPHHLGGTDTDANLTSLSAACHLAKSSAEGVAARAQRSRRRPPEPHPGLRRAT